MAAVVSEVGRDLVRAAVGHDLLCAAVGLLADVDVRVLPLKGIYLQARVYERPELRPITDVDVLVPEGHFEATRERLIAAGWRWSRVNASEATVWSPAHALPLDVHRRLFAPGAFDLSTGAVFDRATRDESCFGVEVFLPDPRDVLAHLVGHFVKSRAGAEDHVHLADFEQLGRSHGLDPNACARHLQATGLGRAARYALRYAARGEPGGFSARVLQGLATDRIGDALASVAAGLRGHAPRRSLVSALPGVLLEPSLARSVRALWSRARR